jgi:hypothetical protein
VRTMVRRISGVVLVLLAFAVGIVVGDRFGIPFVAQRWEWSIGVYEGPSPTSLSSPADIHNPVLRARDVTDAKGVLGVADPFMVRADSTWNLFFELVRNDSITPGGKIALATSPDGRKWTYRQVVLNEPYHLSYPYVFEYDGTYYMIPETSAVHAIRLYRATRFPYEWQFVKTLLSGDDYVDSSIFRYHGLWWIMTESHPSAEDTLRLFYADSLQGKWSEHPMSPIVAGNSHISRPGGRVIVDNGRIIRYAQDDDPTYGNKDWAFEVTKLTPTTYEERRIGIVLRPGPPWTGVGMHTVDPHRLNDSTWIAVVDGIGKKRVFHLGW